MSQSLPFAESQAIKTAWEQTPRLDLRIDLNLFTEGWLACREYHTAVYPAGDPLELLEDSGATNEQIQRAQAHYGAMQGGQG